MKVKVSFTLDIDKQEYLDYMNPENGDIRADLNRAAAYWVSEQLKQFEVDNEIVFGRRK